LSDYVISELLNASEACDVVFIDFAKVFDKVSHYVLQSKLAIVGVTGKLHAWLTDFLNNRTQRVIYQGVKSAPVRVSSGVVQGSVLGPLLFAIMVSDLPA
jgi:ribonuclease P/MRP protein subunit RPP40